MTKQARRRWRAARQDIATPNKTAKIAAVKAALEHKHFRHRAKMKPTIKDK